MSGKPIKLARVIRVGHEAVEFERIDSARLRAGEYDGIMSGDFANYAAVGCSFRIKLPQAVRRPIACQILISPLDVTIVPRPTEMDGLGILTRILQAYPVENHAYWTARIVIARCGDDATYSGQGTTPAAAAQNAVNEALRRAAEWLDADPLEVSEPVESIIDTPHLDPVP